MAISAAEPQHCFGASSHDPITFGIPITTAKKSDHSILEVPRRPLESLEGCWPEFYQDRIILTNSMICDYNNGKAGFGIVEMCTNHCISCMFLSIQQANGQSQPE